METNKVSNGLDTELLQGYHDSLGKSIVENMFALYCQQVKIYLNDIVIAQKNNDISDWKTHCHKMKGAAASVGMSHLHEKLKMMEKTEVSQSDKALLLNDLVAENERAISAFSAWLNAH